VVTTAAGGTNNYACMIELWAIGHVPIVAVCSFGSIGTTMDTIIPFLIAAAVFFFIVGFFFLVTNKRQSRMENSGILVFNFIGLVLIVAVAAALISKMKICG